MQQLRLGFISVTVNLLLNLQVQSSYYLVSLVDNDYINGDLFAVFADL